MNQIEGTGRGGRITRKDVEKHIGSSASAQEEPAPSQEKKSDTAAGKETPAAQKKVSKAQQEILKSL